MYVSGIAIATTGAFLLPIGSSSQDTKFRSASAIGLIGGGLVLAFSGLTVYARSYRFLSLAVDQYNDDLYQRIRTR